MKKLEIIDLRQDPEHSSRLKTGNFRFNKDLNNEWFDLLNNTNQSIDLRGMVVTACNNRSRSAILSDLIPLKAVINSNSSVLIHPGETMRIFTGEQPYESTFIPDEDNISSVLWLLNKTYLWTDRTNEARLYANIQELRKLAEPLATYCYNPWFEI